MARVLENGSLHIRARLVIPADEVEIRVTTSGGPGGQHANRSLTRVVASFDVRESAVLHDEDRALLTERIGTVVRASSSRHRSQAQNKSAALEHLAQKIAEGLARQAPRRASKPTYASKIRRVDEKKARGRVKALRRRSLDD